MDEQLTVKKLYAFEDLVDDRIDAYGVRNTICWLIDRCNFTKDELLALRFDEDDIDFVFENPTADYDG